MKKLSHEDFDPMVSFFDEMVQTTWLRQIHHEIVLLAKENQQGTVLDIGCGTGRLLHRLVSKFKRCVGLDLSPEMVKLAQKQANEYELDHLLEFVVGDAYDLPFEDEQFEATFSTCVMFLLPEPEIGLGEMIRVTKPNGQLIMLNPSPAMSPRSAKKWIADNKLEGFDTTALLQWSNVSQRKHRFPKEQIEEMLTQRGMINVRFKDVLNGLAHITIATKK